MKFRNRISDPCQSKRYCTKKPDMRHEAARHPVGTRQALPRLIEGWANDDRGNIEKWVWTDREMIEENPGKAAMIIIKSMAFSRGVSEYFLCILFIAIIVLSKKLWSK